MKIFFLDDNINRHTKFHEWIETKCEQPDIISASSANEATGILEKDKEFDVIFLDHDLGGKIFVSSKDPNTGYAVAEYIKKNDVKYKQCFIHSQNPVGAKNMKNVLEDAMLIPFPQLMRS